MSDHRSRKPGFIEKASKARIGHIVRAEYRYETPPSPNGRSGSFRSRRQSGKTRPCVIVGIVNDQYYAVAPISSRTSQNDITLTPQHQKNCRLRVSGRSYIEKGEYNLIHHDSASFERHEDGEFFRGVLYGRPLSDLRSDFQERWQAKSLSARVHQQDPVFVDGRKRAEALVSQVRTPAIQPEVPGAPPSAGRNTLTLSDTARQRAADMARKGESLPGFPSLPKSIAKKVPFRSDRTDPDQEIG